MGNLEQRLGALEDSKKLVHSRPMSDAELAVRLFRVFSGPEAVDQELVDRLEDIIRSNARE